MKPSQSLNVSHWPARLIGVVGAIVFAAFGALSMAAESPCGVIFFVAFIPVCVLLVLISGRTSMNQRGITLSTPLGRYALGWDEIRAVVVDTGGNSIVFKGEGRQLVVPALWAGPDKQEMQAFMARELQRRGIGVSKRFAAFAISHNCRVKGWSRSGDESRVVCCRGVCP